ncbi:MAG TPA: DUF6268 family outer membrane beta-barrel protein [Puia sp.]|nr:DUF6268 family outer membrane beta-barrel protein [Puia sp.]
MKNTITVWLLLLAGLASGQDIRLAGIEYFNYLKAPVSDGNSKYQASFQEFSAFAAYPVQSKNKKTTILNGFQYALVDASVLDNTTTVTNTRNFYVLAYNFIVIHKLNDNWKLEAQLTPTLSSDFKSSLSSNDFLMLGSFLAIRRLNDYANIGAGITYTTKLGKPLLLPVLQFNYHKDHHKLIILLPSLVDYEYGIDKKDKFNVGFRAGLNGAEFHVTGNNIDNAIDVNKLGYSRLNLGPVVSYRISKIIKIEAMGGISVARKYQFLDVQGNKYTINSKNVGVFNIGIAFVPPLLK